jgi:hypothetical protein
MPKITFLEAANRTRLSKEFSKQGKQSYPMYVNKFTSHIHDIPATNVGWDTQYQLMKKHAPLGHCLLKGQLDRPLVNEPRKGHTDRYQKTETLVLDIDGLELEGYTIPESISSTDIKDIAERIVKLLPPIFSNSSYIATASASLGLKQNLICMHLDFYLSAEVNPMRLKDWITWLNLNIKDFSTQVSLNTSGLSLSYPIDRTLAQNDKLIYCAPPTFIPPLIDPVEERIVLVKKDNPTVDISILLKQVNVEANTQAIKDTVIALRKSAGLKRRTPKTRYVTLEDGHKTEVLENPDQARITYAYHTIEYCYFNINNGDSNAYWCPIGNPRIVYTFKDEPPFEMQRVDADFHEWYTEEFKDEIRGAANLRPFIFRDFWTDVHYNAVFDENNNNIPRIASANKSNLGDFMLEHGLAMPEPIPTWDYVFDPSTDKQIDFQRQWLNKYQPTDYLLNAKPLENIELTYGDATLLQNYCPTIYKIIWHLVGDSSLEYEHFINWLAYGVKRRCKTTTAWVFSGVEGTGKGVFYHKVLVPLIGNRYSVMRKLSDFDDQFNAWQETNLITVVDEARINDVASSSRTMNFLKNFITEPYGKVRVMRVDSLVDKPLYNNVMFYTNNQDALKLSATDRRFNIGIHQELSLIRAYPKIRQEIDDLLPKELQIFTNFLTTYSEDEDQARTPLENEAKLQMREASMTWIEEYSFAIRTGNLDFFVKFVDMEPTAINEITTFEAAQRFIKSWIADVDQRKSFVTVAQLRTVYTCLNDATISAVKFGKLLARNGIITINRRGKGRGLVVDWKLDTYERTPLINEHFSDRDKEAYKCQNEPQQTH